METLRQHGSGAALVVVFLALGVLGLGLALTGLMLPGPGLEPGPEPLLALEVSP